MVQGAQIVGAILILIGFGLNQAGRLSPQSVQYLVLNLVGALVLLVVAAIGRDFGFLLLETAWAGMSARGLIRRPPYAAPQ